MGKKKEAIVLDLSKSQEAQRMAEFEVENYDYELRQGSKVAGFEQDLQFLLSEREETMGTSGGGKNRKKRGKMKPKTPESTPPISTNSVSVERAASGKFSELSTQSAHLRIDLAEIAPKTAENCGPEKHSKLRGKRKPTREVQRISRKEITGDLDGIDFSSDDETPARPKTSPEAVSQRENSGSISTETTESVKESAKAKKNKKKKEKKEKEKESVARAEIQEPQGNQSSRQHTPIPETMPESGTKLLPKAKSRKSSKKKDEGSSSSANSETSKSPAPEAENVSVSEKKTRELSKTMERKELEGSNQGKSLETPQSSETEAQHASAPKKQDRISSMSTKKKDPKGSKISESSEGQKSIAQDTETGSLTEKEKTQTLKSTKQRETKGLESTESPGIQKSTVPEISEKEPKPLENKEKSTSKPNEISEVQKTDVQQTEPISTPKKESSSASKSPASSTGSPSAQNSTEIPLFPRLSSAKATQIKQLPAVPPVSTIFGLTHEQIFTTKLTDVKVKTIANVPMSKMCKNALTFVMAENEGLFADKLKTAHFVDLCTKVALYEAPGFNEVTKRIPELLEWVPRYEALTLQHTKTNVTISNKQIHQNSLDYSVFSFFGHILIWANELQHTAKLPTISETFELDLSRSDIMQSLGGYHLWDRLRRNKTINTKRWKHIQKFRQLFAFEEHQFVLILRCMNLGLPVN